MEVSVQQYKQSFASTLLWVKYFQNKQPSRTGTQMLENERWYKAATKKEHILRDETLEGNTRINKALYVKREENKLSDFECTCPSNRPS